MPLRGQLSIGSTLAIAPLAKAASRSSWNESQPGVIEKRMEKYLDHACIDTLRKIPLSSCHLERETLANLTDAWQLQRENQPHDIGVRQLLGDSIPLKAAYSGSRSHSPHAYSLRCYLFPTSSSKLNSSRPSRSYRTAPGCALHPQQSGSTVSRKSRSWSWKY